ncbi:MAG: hypothetical protein RBS39_07445 [Phycisphaerales bacterium]|jgi:hypothetical protein|nr:hypothetical protein [Phycisphaerales bacterium]
MIKTLGTVAGIVIATSASAQTLFHTFDMTGLVSEGGFGTNFPTLTHDFGVAGVVVAVEWDVSYESFDPSWNSEAQIAIDTNDDASFDADIDPSLFGAPDSSGVFAYFGSIGANTISSDGLVFLTTYESFDDASSTPDALYRQGFVRVTYRAVPAPGALAAFGAMGLVVTRRRR